LKSMLSLALACDEGFGEELLALYQLLEELAAHGARRVQHATEIWVLDRLGYKGWSWG